ncbi:MAG: cation:proton antiporter [Ignavibacteriaceae bacterium]|nr:cation:proton antiporter [Ignavibacteriaceae bacterium]
MEGFFTQSIIYLAAAVLCVPLAKKLGLSSVIGYLIAGMLIGPFLLGFVGEEGKDIMHFAEFGVVMMLFLIGLELEPQNLWRMRKLILGAGLSQVAGTTIFIAAAAIFSGLAWNQSLAVALAIAMSSTAIVMQSLKEKGLMQSAAGQHSFAVLLFQDISVIPILAIIPLLALTVTDISSEHVSYLETFPGWVQTLVVLSAVGLVILIGRYAIVPLLRLVARTRLRELFTASALLIVIGIAYLMTLVGLSPALGTFLAGVILAGSEFRHELESDLDPFKGLLLGLFFMAVGASINFNLIAEQPWIIFSSTLLIMAGKFAVLFIIGKVFRLSIGQNLIFSIGLAGVGEFAFVLFSFISQLRITGQETTDMLMAITAISMAVSPVLMLINEKFLLVKFGVSKKPEQDADKIDEQHKVIIAGFSHFGSTIGRFLRANGVEATILDNNTDTVDLLRRMGFKVFYGDATRPDLLESAGAAEAKILISAVDSPETAIQISETVKKHFPRLQLLVRSKNRFDAYELMDIGITDIYRENLDTSIRLGRDVLVKLGFRSYSVHRAAQNFLRYDEEAMKDLAAQRHNMKEYISGVREKIGLQEALLRRDLDYNPSETDHAWDSDHLRQAITGKT